jgi:hypothetical protein
MSNALTKQVLGAKSIAKLEVMAPIQRLQQHTAESRFVVVLHIFISATYVELKNQWFDQLKYRCIL